MRAFVMVFSSLLPKLIFVCIDGLFSEGVDTASVSQRLQTSASPSDIQEVGEVMEGGISGKSCFGHSSCNNVRSWYSGEGDWSISPLLISTSSSWAEERPWPGRIQEVRGCPGTVPASALPWRCFLITETLFS